MHVSIDNKVFGQVHRFLDFRQVGFVLEDAPVRKQEKLLRPLTEDHSATREFVILQFRLNNSAPLKLRPMANMARPMSQTLAIRARPRLRGKRPRLIGHRQARIFRPFVALCQSILPSISR